MKDIETIITTIVYEYFGITKRDYQSRRREQVLARQISTSFFIKFLKKLMINKITLPVSNKTSFL